MADHSDFLTTEAYAALLARIDARIDDAIKALRSDQVTPTNLPTYSIRMNLASTSAAKWESWSGAAWVDAATKYNISVQKATCLDAGVPGAIPYQSAVGTTGYSVAGTSGQVLTSGGTGAPTWANMSALTAGAVANSLTFNNSGAGAASGATFNGSAAATISYNTVGAPKADGTGASGTWGISISGNAGTASTCGGFYPGGLQEIGRYLDFHSASNGFDFDCRFDAQAGASNGAGTMALTANVFVCSGNVAAYSDERKKKNWRKLPSDFLVRLAEIKSGTYERKDIKGLRQAGVSAQSLRDVLPEAVLEGVDGFLSVAYGNAALVAAVELAKEVQVLRARIEKLEVAR